MNAAPQIYQWPARSFLVAVFIVVAVASAESQTPDALNPSANNFVNVLAIQPDGKILVGGGFTNLAGQTRNYIGRLNSDGTVDTSFNPGANNSVICLSVQTDGKILVGGNFTTLAAQTRNSIGRINSSGTVDFFFNPSVGGIYGNTPVIDSLAVQPDGKILVGGFFDMLTGVARTNIGRLNSDGTLDTTFKLGTGYVFDNVYSLGIQPDGRIVVGGSFATFGGKPHTNIVRLNANGTLDTNFNAGANSTVFSLALQADGKILVGGSFTNLVGRSCDRIGRLNSDGSLDTNFNAGANSSVYSLVLQTDGKILVGGLFTNLAGQTCSRIGRLNSDGSLDASFNTSANSNVLALAVQADGKILVGGSFTNLTGQERNRIGRLNNTDASTQSLSFDGATITWLRGATCPEVLRTSYDASTNSKTWITLGGGTRVSNGWQLSGLVFPSNTTIRARGFTTGGRYNGSASFVESSIGPPVITGQPTGRKNNAFTAATFNVTSAGTMPFAYQWQKDGLNLSNGGNVSGTETSSLTISNVLGADSGGYSVIVTNSFGSVTSSVASLTVVDPIITAQPLSQSVNPGQTAGFNMSTLGSLPTTYHWRKDGTNLADTLTPSLVLTNAQRINAGNYDVVVSNAFGSVTSVVVMLTVNVVTSDSFPWGMGCGGDVGTFAMQPDGKVLLGAECGFSSHTGPFQFFNCGRLNADNSLDVIFNPAGSFSIGIQDDNKILVGGPYVKTNGNVTNYIERLNPDGTVDPTFIALANGGWGVVLQEDGKILLGGAFTSLNGQAQTNIGRFNSDGTLDADFKATVYSEWPHSIGPRWGSPIFCMMVQSDGKILVGGAFSKINGQVCSGIGRLNANGTLDSTFNASADGDVICMILQPDGKIVVGGQFSQLNGYYRSHIGRLNTDGSVDSSFDPRANDDVYSLALQADGKIIVGGYFEMLGGQARTNVGRLNQDGTVDSTFNPGVSPGGPANDVTSIFLQADGRLIVVGLFGALNGQPASSVGRLNNTDPATEYLSFDGSNVNWQRGGTVPEIIRSTFYASIDRTNWVSLGAGSRCPGGWQKSGVAIPTNTTIRARGYVSGSSWFVESKFTVDPRTPPRIIADDSGFGFKTNAFGFNFAGLGGQVVVVESSTDLLNWIALSTNTIGSGPLYFSDPNSSSFSARFYRARLR